MKPSWSCGTPGSDGPRSRGRLTTRSASITLAGTSDRLPSSTVSGVRPVWSFDAPLREQLAQGRRGAHAENLERLRLGRDDRHLHVAEAAIPRVLGGHERQLVERQRPRGRGGHGEGDTPDVVALEIAQQRAVPARVARSHDGDGPGQGGHGRCADRQQQDLVSECPPVPGLDGVLARVDRPYAGEMHRGSVPSRQPHDVEAAHASEPERLSHHERPILEVRRGGDELDLHALLGQAPKSDHRLQGSHPTPDDRDLHVVLLGWKRGSASGPPAASG